MDLSTFFRVLVRNWWLIALSVITTAGSAAWVVSRQSPRYAATAQVWLRPSDTLQEPHQVVNVITALDRRTMINTVARMATSTSMVEHVSQSLGVLPVMIEESELTAIVLPDTNLIDIRATNTNPELAAAIVNTAAEGLRGRVPEKALQLDIINAAAPPTEPVYPQPVRTITLGVLFGLALGIMFALFGYMLQFMRATQTTAEPARGVDQGMASPVSAAIEPAPGSAQTQQLYTR
jgi:capsular polysaccharide biosynthesis protein